MQLFGGVEAGTGHQGMTALGIIVIPQHPWCARIPVRFGHFVAAERRRVVRPKMAELAAFATAAFVVIGIAEEHVVFPPPQAVFAVQIGFDGELLFVAVVPTEPAGRQCAPGVQPA